LPDRAQPLPREQRDLVAAVSRQIVAPIERARAAADAEQARLAVESERLRSTLLSSVSHDLRTPLAAITGAASGVLDGLPPEMTPARELLATVVEEAERLDRLVGNLLDMTRLEAGALEPKREWLTLEEIVGSAVDRVERYAGQGIVDVEVAPDLPLAFIDGVLIEQAIVNLLENAVRHGEGESIAISARKDGDSAVVEVSDRGPGFLAENAARLFEKFHRFADGAGSGLGLAIARAIVTAHGGRIQAERLDPHGARFAFTLPLSQTPPKAPVEDLPDVAD
jgi:two-component system sensor histidine kinase KdpD